MIGGWAGLDNNTTKDQGVGAAEGATVLVVCAGDSAGDGVGVAEGATVLVVCGCVPAGDALANGVTVAVGTGLD